MGLYDFLSKSVGKIVTCSKTYKGTDATWVIEFSNNTSYEIYCAWRFKCGRTIITTGFESVATGVTTDSSEEMQGLEYMNKHVERLIGSKLLSYELSAHYDLTLYFENDYSVNVFCDIIVHGQEEDAAANCNWVFSVPEEKIVGGVTGLFKEDYASSLYARDDGISD